MQRSSVRKAQTEPFAALAAMAIIALALALFAGVFEASVPGPVDRNLAEPTADRVERHLTVGGVVRPDNLENATTAGPEGYRTNVTLVSGGETTSVGPATPPTADNATRRVAVYDEPGDVDPGRLEVSVWT